MNVSKKVKALLPSSEIRMDEIPIKQAMPTHAVPNVDPFLLVHHIKIPSFNDRPARVQGIEPHPQRGFTKVTFIIEGELHHRDSRGNSEVALKGEAQWMHAGMGIIHSERPSIKLAANNGTLETIQLWINSPAKSKMKVPFFKRLTKEEIPVFYSEDQKVKNKLIAGSYHKLQSKIPTESETLIIWGNAEENGIIKYTISKNYNVMLYVNSGSCNLKEFGLIEKEQLLVFAQFGEQIDISFSEDCEYLLFAGVPIGEKVKQSGPFVMNSQTEILEAMRDYKMGKMGILIEED